MKKWTIIKCDSINSALMMISIFVILFFAEFTSGSKNNKHMLETVSISVVFRHGDRAPENHEQEKYPNDPYKNTSFYLNGLGQLTNRGKLRIYNFGILLRSLYDDFLGQDFKPCLVKARSTAVDRTKMSLMLILSSLYTPQGSKVWNTKLNWQPIPISHVPLANDSLMATQRCPQFIKEMSLVRKLPEIQAEIEKFRPLMKNLTRWTGRPFLLSSNTFYLYHALMAVYSMGLELPKWARTIFPYGLLWNATLLEYKIRSYNTKLRRLNGGALLKEIIENMRIIIRNTTNCKSKINLYSGHDINVAGFLAALEVFEPHVPEYASGIIVKLRRDNMNKYYVKLLYHSGVSSGIKVLQIPGCDVNCLFDDFIKLLNNNIPTDEELICS